MIVSEISIEEMMKDVFNLEERLQKKAHACPSFSFKTLRSGYRISIKVAFIQLNYLVKSQPVRMFSEKTNDFEFYYEVLSMDHGKMMIEENEFNDWVLGKCVGTDMPALKCA